MKSSMETEVKMSSKFDRSTAF